MRHLIVFLVIFFQFFWTQTAVRLELDRKQVDLDGQIQMKFIIENGQGGSHDFTPSADFLVQAGPFKSSSSSMSWINGTSQSQQNVTITYLLRPKKVGKINIPIYTYQDKNGVTYQTEPIEIQVTENEPVAEVTEPIHVYEKNLGKDIFASIEANKTEVFEGEPIVLTYQIYTRYELSGIVSDSKPTLKNVWSEDIKLSEKGYEVKHVTLGGRGYYCYSLKKELIYPQKSGEIELTPWKISVTTGDGFFSQRQSFDLKSKSFVLKINPLPKPKPKNFIGLVGTFSLESKLDKMQVAVNEALQWKIQLQGKGNFYLLNRLPLDLPQDFEVFDPKITENTNITLEGSQGSKTFEYLFIPRFAGKYEIPPLDLSYFDVKEKKYKNLVLPKYELEILKGQSQENTNSYTLPIAVNPNKQDIKSAQNIQPIARDLGKIFEKKELENFDTFWNFYLASWLLAFLLLVIINLYFFWQKKQKNIKNSGREALKNLKNLRKKSKKDPKILSNHLHDWWTNYLSEKLVLSKAEFSLEKVEEKLKNNKNISENLTIEILNSLKKLEIYRFSPQVLGEKDLDQILEKLLFQLEKKWK